MGLLSIFGGLKDKAKEKYADSQISMAKQGDGKYKLVLVGYKTLKKNRNVSHESPRDFETSTIRFSSEEGLLSQIRAYKDRGQLLDTGKPKKEEYTYFVQVNPDCLKEKDFLFPINREFVPRFGKIETIVFNWGGVIANDLKAAHAATDKTLREYGHKGMSWYEWIVKKNSDPIVFLINQGILGNPEIVSNPRGHLIKDGTIEESKNESQEIRLLLNSGRLKGSGEASDPIQVLISRGTIKDPREMEKKYREFYKQEKATSNRPVLYPQVEEIIRYLKEREKNIAVLSRYEKTDLINNLIGFNLITDIPYPFQDAENKEKHIHLACETFDEKPQNVLYVDDTADGIAAAWKAGVHPAGILTGYGTKEELESERPEFMFSNLNDIKKYIN